MPNRGWDYLQFFLDEAHKRNLKVTVSTTIFPMGMPKRRQGPVYRGCEEVGRHDLHAISPQRRRSQMVDIKDDPTKVAAFLNPGPARSPRSSPLRFIREIVTNYDFDAYALDYCRFPDYQSDFSEASKDAFEDYIKGSVSAPGPMMSSPTMPPGNIVPGIYYKEWWEFRSMIIHDFVARVRGAPRDQGHQAGREIGILGRFVVGRTLCQRTELGQQGVPSMLTDQDAWSFNYIWCSNNYYRTGFAEELDTFLLGAYLERIYGADDNESVEYAINRAERMLRNACTMYGTIGLRRSDISTSRRPATTVSNARPD